jgi:hypothetical protein
MSLLDDLGDLLSTGSTGVVGTDLFLGRMPDTPAACTSIAETGGFAPVHAMASGPGQAVLELPRVQILARAATYSAAKLRIKTVESLLDGLRPRLINGTQYHFAQAVQPPFLLEYDANQRPVMAQNYDIQKARSTA